MIGVNYSASGTIGRSDAATMMTSGKNAVTGGFRALPTAVQTTGVPNLTIVPAEPRRPRFCGLRTRSVFWFETPREIKTTFKYPPRCHP